MYSNPDAAACNRRLGAKDSKEKACNPHENEFFSLFDFDAESSSTKAETTDSPLKSIQGAASAVFGGIWSALDTAISILNEDMNMGDSLQEMTTSEHDGTYGDSLMDDHVDGYLEQSKKSSAIDAEAQNKEVEILSSVLEPLLDERASTQVQQSVPKSPLSIMGKCLTGSTRFFADSFERSKGTSSNHNNNVDSDYYIINSETCKGETNDGWLVVSDE